MTCSSLRVAVTNSSIARLACWCETISKKRSALPSLLLLINARGALSSHPRLAWLVAVGPHPAASSAKSLPFTTLTLIRSIGNNHLFRGPEQSILGFWADAALRAQMRLLAPSLRTYFYMVDLNLLHSAKGVPDENAERRYFEKRPEKGRFVWWPTNGTKLDAYNRSAADAAAKVRQWNSTLRSVVLAGSIPCRRGSMRSSGSSKHLVPTTGALRSTSTARVARTARERCQGATICAT